MSSLDRPFEVTTRDRVSIIAFNRPGRANAFAKTVWDEFPAVLRDADAEPATNAIVITGKGRYFCTGGDVDRMGTVEPVNVRVRHEGLEMVEAMLTVEKPVVAMVNGAAIGLGATLALLSDCVVMSDRAYFADTHVPLGIVAGDGAVAAATLLVGPHRAREFLLTGRRISAEEAHRMGLAGRCVPEAELELTTFELAGALADQPPYAVRATKLAVNAWMRKVAHRMLDVAFAYEKISMGMPEHRQAIEGFRSRATADRASANGAR